MLVLVVLVPALLSSAASRGVGRVVRSVRLVRRRVGRVARVVVAGGGHAQGEAHRARPVVDRAMRRAGGEVSAVEVVGRCCVVLLVRLPPRLDKKVSGAGRRFRRVPPAAACTANGGRHAAGGWGGG